MRARILNANWTRMIMIHNNHVELYQRKHEADMWPQSVKLGAITDAQVLKMIDMADGINYTVYMEA